MNELFEIVHGVAISSPIEFTILGETKTLGATTGLKVADEPDGLAEPLLTALAQELYHRFYCRPRSRDLVGGRLLEQRDHLAALSAANSGHGAWEAGWKVETVEKDGQIAVSRDGVKFWTSSDGIKTNSSRLTEGVLCRVRVAKEMRFLLPGFYCAIGDGDAESGKDESLHMFRIYWNIPHDAASKYISLITNQLNSIKVPFRTKVLSDPASYARADAGVLYIEARYLERCWGALREVYNELRDAMRPEVPMFTKRLGPGIALAQDPGGGQSFGQSRCRLIAEALWSAHELSATAPIERLHVVVAFLNGNGYEIEGLYLNSDWKKDELTHRLIARAEAGFENTKSHAAAITAQTRQLSILS
jgi:hypothetical protein